MAQGTEQAAVELVEALVPILGSWDGSRGESVKARAPAKRLGLQLGARWPHTTSDRERHVIYATPAEAEEIEDGELVLPPRAEPQHSFRVLGRSEPQELGGPALDDLPSGTYVPLYVTPARVALADTEVDAKGTRSVKGHERPAATAPSAAPERPLVDPAVWRSQEQLQTMQQLSRWEAAWRRLSERERAEILAHVELEILWDRLDQDERSKVLERIQEDRDWPGLRERMETEERARRQKLAKQERARQARLEKQRAQEEQEEAEAVERREREERLVADFRQQKEREQEEERERRAEEERERLRQERDALASADGTPT